MCAMEHGLHNPGVNQSNSLSNKELRAVLYADAPLYAQKKSERNYTGMNTFGVCSLFEQW